MVANAQPDEHLVALRSQLLSLGRSESQIYGLRERIVDSTTTTEHSIIEVLELWQQLFRDTFQQYHRLSSRLVHGQDSAAALRLWHEYLMHVQAFLSDALPDDYSSLNEHRHLCEIHENLLNSQQAVLSLPTNVDPVLAEQINSLSALHSETLTRIVDRHTETGRRLTAWDQYKNDQSQLLEWLKERERERSRLQLRYIHLRRVQHTLHSIDALLVLLPYADKECANLRQQQTQLVHFCNDALVTSMRMEHSAIVQRVDNLRAALQTWHDFLAKIVTLGKTYNQKVHELRTHFDDVQLVVTRTSNDMPTASAHVEQCMGELRSQRLRLNQLTADLETVNVIQEELKECISPTDMKSIRQMVWLLWQQQADLDQQLAALIARIEERLSLNTNFHAKYDRLMQWMDNIENRLDTESQSELYDPEELLRRLEKDIQSEIALREREKEWLLSSGHELLSFYDGNNGTDQLHRDEIQLKLNSIIDRWERLKMLCKSRATKIHDLKLTMTRLEERIAAIRAWLYQMEVSLSKPLVYASSTNVSFEQLIHEHEKYQRAIEKESSNVGEVLNLCEMLLSDVDAWKAHFNTETLTTSVHSLERRWKNVCNLSANRKRRIHTVWTLLLEVLSLTSDQEIWVLAQENELSTLEKGLEHLTTSQVRARIDHLETKIKEIEQRSPTFKILKQSYSKLVKSDGLDPANIQELTSSAKLILARYANLVPHALDIIGKLNMDMKFHREFINTHGKAIVALTQIDTDLTKVQHLSKANPEEQLRSIQVLEQELKMCENDLSHADKLGLVIMKKAKPEDIEETQTLIDEYQTLWRDINTRMATIKIELTTTITKLKLPLESAAVQKRRTETDSAVQVNTLPGLNRTSSITPKDAYIYELEAALKECEANLDNLEREVNDPNRKPGSQVVTKAISNSQSSVELLNHLSTILITECFCTNEEAAVVQVAEISARYEMLVALWKAKERQHEQNRYVFCGDLDLIPIAITFLRGVCVLYLFFTLGCGAYFFCSFFH